LFHAPDDVKAIAPSLAIEELDGAGGGVLGVGSGVVVAGGVDGNG
jgi:hypothetical protein